MIRIPLLFFLAFLSGVFSQSQPNGQVVELTDLDFDEFIAKNPVVMVLFYAPFCSKSKAFIPEFQKAAALAHKVGKTYILAKIDTSSQTEVADKLDIQMTPTVKLFINKTKTTYDKDLTMEGIIRYIDKSIRPASVEITQLFEVKALQDVKGFKCILISDDEKVKADFIATHNILKEIPLYHMSENLGKLAFKNATTFPSIILLSSTNEEGEIYTGKIGTTELINFIEDNMFPTVTNITQESMTQVLKPYGRKGVMLFRTPNEAKQLDADFLKLSIAHKSAKYIFIVGDCKETMGERVAKHVGIDSTKSPQMVIVEKKEDLARYEYKGELTFEAMDKYLTLFKEGKISRTMKSEDEPKENNGPVYKVVGKTFKQDVIDNQMDVFVKFYAPWCGHCKELAPIYHDLAKKLSGNKNLKLVEVDSTANEIPGFNIKSYPTLKLFAGNNKTQPIDYEEARSEEAMLEFLKKNCFNKIDVPAANTK